MKYFKIFLITIFILVFTIKLVIPGIIGLIFSEPWNNIKVSIKENQADLESKQKIEVFYKEKLTEAITKKDPGICNELPELPRSYARDQDGKIIYVFRSTSGGPTGPHRLHALLRYQCKIAYAITSLDANSCQTYANNDIQNELCLIEVAQEMRLLNIAGYDKVCSMIATDHTTNINECLSTLRVESKKSYYTDNIEWGA